MARLNGKGPEEKGSATGRGLGNCCWNKNINPDKYQLGQGMGKRRKAGSIETKN